MTSPRRILIKFPCITFAAARRGWRNQSDAGWTPRPQPPQPGRPPGTPPEWHPTTKAPTTQITLLLHSAGRQTGWIPRIKGVFGSDRGCNRYSPVRHAGLLPPHNPAEACDAEYICTVEANGGRFPPLAALGTTPFRTTPADNLGRGLRTSFKDDFLPLHTPRQRVARHLDGPDRFSFGRLRL